MSELLQNILYGTFISPDVPGRKISFDDIKRNISSMPVASRKVASKTAVTDVLKAESHEWLTIGSISALSGVCNDTSAKVLNQLASEHLVLKRFAKTSKQGPKTAVFKWINKDANKQKAA